MPYGKTEIPQNVKNLPKGAQDIYRAAFNAAYDKYGEERAHAIAWSAVKRSYKKKGDTWVAKDSMEIEDTVTFDSSMFRMTADGFLVTEPRVARTGIQLYSGWQCGRPDVETVKVFRPEATVFDKAAMATFAYRPITYGHPEDGMVNADNWREHSVGQTGADVARDGEYLRVPMVIMDAKTIKRIRDENRELSVGYLSDLDWTPGTTPQGETYDAVQSNIKANHIAVVARARGGPELRLGDNTTEDQDMPDIRMKTITLDGINVDVPEFSASVIEREYGRLNTKVNDSATQLAALQKQVNDQAAEITTLKTSVSAKDGEIAVHMKAIEDSKITPQMLDTAMKARLAIVTKAQKILGDGFKFDDKSDADIKRAVVDKHFGRETKMDDASINGAFEAVVIKPGTTATSDGVNQLAAMFGGRTEDAAPNVDLAYDKRIQRYESAWKMEAKH